MHRRLRSAILAPLFLAAACTGAPQADPAPSGSPPVSPSPTPAPSPTPTEPPTTFKLAVIGDFGSGDENEWAISARIRTHVDRHGTHALVTTGDNIYPNAKPKYFDTAWRRPYAWVAERKLRMIASLGNHDVAGDLEAVMKLLSIPARYYKATVGDADIFVLDANQPHLPGQATWLSRELRASKAAWQIAVFHQPAFSCSLHGNTQAVVDRWVPIFEAEGIDLVLNGHDHNYQRFEARKGVTYIVTGGGGYEMYGLLPCPSSNPKRLAKNGTDHHFVAIDGGRDELRIQAIKRDGAVFDDVTLRR